MLMENKKNQGVCDLINVSEDPISLKQFQKPCHFHLTERTFESTQVIPGNLCPEVYYLTYPYMFATAYGAKFEDTKKNKKTFCCPNPKIRAEFELERTKAPAYERFKNAVKVVLGSSMIYQVAMQYCGVNIKVKKNQNEKFSQCPKKNMNKGDRYSINFGEKEGVGMCPAGFRSVFPYQSLNFLRSKNGNNKDQITTVTCPDHIKQLQFTVGKNNNKSNADSNEVCEISDDVNIKMEDKDTSMRNIMMDLKFPCPVLFNIGFPYFLTVANGGKLGFYTNSHRSAMIQCPNSKVRVHARIGKSKNGKYFEYVITNVDGKNECPKGIKTGDIFKLPIKKSDQKVDFDDLNYIIYYSAIAKEQNNKISIQRPFNNKHYSLEPNYLK